MDPRPAQNRMKHSDTRFEWVCLSFSLIGSYTVEGISAKCDRRSRCPCRMKACRRRGAQTHLSPVHSVLCGKNHTRSERVKRFDCNLSHGCCQDVRPRGMAKQGCIASKIGRLPDRRRPLAALTEVVAVDGHAHAAGASASAHQFGGGDGIDMDAGAGEQLVRHLVAIIYDHVARRDSQRV